MTLHLTLKRHIVANGAVIGELTGLSKRLFTLEDQWNNNVKGNSCIIAGTYQCVPHGWDANTKVSKPQTWELQKVPGRSSILIHAGNYTKDTQGCILVGLGMSISQLQSMVADSKFALDYMRKEIGAAEFTITIE